MNRRDFLQVAALLTAGTGLAPHSWSMSSEQKTFLASMPDYIDRGDANFFSAVQRSTATTIAEHIIPATETPGAIDAGAPRFIELMVADWFNDQERTAFMAGLDAFIAKAGNTFSTLPAEQRLKLLEEEEDNAGDSDWYKMGNTMRIWDDSAPFICQIKELTVLGFFLSEVGATQVLRNNPMGSFNGDIPLAEDDAAYNALIPMRVMFEGRSDAI